MCKVKKRLEVVMLFSKCRLLWLFFSIGLLVNAPLSNAIHPYQDRHFPLGSTSASSVSTAGTHSNCFPSGTGMVAGSGLSSAQGSNCPPVTNAILQLYVPDCLQVVVNGQPTKPQTLGGIHKNSRILSLEGLSQTKVSPCDIVVYLPRVGETKYAHSLNVRAGERYEVRFPHNFHPAGTVAPEDIESCPFCSDHSWSPSCETVHNGPAVSGYTIEDGALTDQIIEHGCTVEDQQVIIGDPSASVGNRAVVVDEQVETVDEQATERGTVRDEGQPEVLQGPEDEGQADIEEEGAESVDGRSDGGTGVLNRPMNREVAGESDDAATPEPSSPVNQ